MASADFHELVLKYAPWSYSKVGALKCLRQFHWRYVEKRKEGRKSAEALVGTAAHGVIETGLKMPGYDLDAAREAQAVKGELNHEERLQLNARMPAIVAFLERIQKFREANGIGEPYVEHQLAFTAEYQPVQFFNNAGLMRGVVDLGLRTPDDYLLVIDHKNGKRKPIREHAGQFYTYKLMAIIQWPWVRGVQCGIHYIGDPKIDWYPRPDNVVGAWTRAEIAEHTVPWLNGFLNRTRVALKVIEGMKAGVPAPPTPSPLCAFCGYEKDCKEGKVAANRYRAKKAAREGTSVNV
jgi:hypothetical protein